MCNLYCHGCKKPILSCLGHEETYLWVEKEDLFVDEQTILDREMSSIDPFEGDFDDFDDFDDWGDLDTWGNPYGEFEMFIRQLQFEVELELVGISEWIDDV